MTNETIDRLLSQLDIHPVLVDIGAAGGAFSIWDDIARHSVYVGFDPDLSGVRETTEGRFYRTIIMNEAITTEGGRNEVSFYLTKSPSCSSTLKPDTEALSAYLFSGLFEVEKETMVRAASLSSVIDRLSLPGVDWFKADSQGTDLRIFKALRDEVRSRVLAVDIEPGLIDAYAGEDLFVDAHRELTQNGFWLSNLSVGGAVRMRRDTVDEVMASNKDITLELLQKILKKSPAWCGARYFRTLEWLSQGDFTRRDYAVLWAFAILDGQFGFALDLAVEYKNVFKVDDFSQLMKEEPVRQIKNGSRRSQRGKMFNTAKSLVPNPMKRWLKEFVQ